MAVEVSVSAEDPLGLSAAASESFEAGGGGTRTIERSLLAHKVEWDDASNSVGFQLGPTMTGPAEWYTPAGPATLTVNFYVRRACDLVACEIFKHPAQEGSIPVALWDSDGTEMGTAEATWSVDEGGWRRIDLDSPVPLEPGVEYTLGYLTPGSSYAWIPWAWNSQDTCVEPFVVRGLVESPAPFRSHASSFVAGPALTFPSTHGPANFCISPVAQWEDDTPAFAPGYEEQFETAGSNFAFPVGVFFADPQFLVEYAALGVNTLVAGGATDEYIDAVKAAGMDWYPGVRDDVSAVLATLDDPALAGQVRGYFLTDEPDLVTPWNSPDVVRGWRDAIRVRDSTRPIMLNLSFLPVKNQGFNWQPVGATPEQANDYWREYAALPDILSCDFYSLAADDSFSPTTPELGGSGPVRFGVWAYPAQVGRMSDLCDARLPIWGVVESTSQVPGAPTAEDVRRACWALLIAGARGLVFFDHRFASGYVTQDFAAMLNDPEMSAMVGALSDQLQALGSALLSAEAGLVEAVTSSGTMPAPRGGYPGGARVPVHYASRVAGGESYVFAQAIRPGDTTATLTVPSLASQTLTVIGESRTVDVDAGGGLVDAFDDGDYTVHLYTTA